MHAGSVLGMEPCHPPQGTASPGELRDLACHQLLLGPRLAPSIPRQLTAAALLLVPHRQEKPPQTTAQVPVWHIIQQWCRAGFALRLCDAACKLRPYQGAVSSSSQHSWPLCLLA